MKNENLELLNREQLKEKYVGSAELFSDLIARTKDCKALVVRIPSFIRSKEEEENGVKIFFFFNGKFNILNAKQTIKDGSKNKFFTTGFKISFLGSNNLSAGCLETEFLIPASSFLYSQNENEDRLVSIFKIN
jgi:hypothetical protein